MIKISSKAGAPFKNNIDGMFNPMDSIIDKFINEKNFSNKVETKVKLRALLMKHFLDVRTLAIEQIDGIDLPNNLGRIQVMKFLPEKSTINWNETNKLKREKNINKLVYHTNNHTNGYICKAYYRTSHNITKGITLAYYKNKKLWGFEAGRVFNVELSKFTKSTNSVVYHTIEKDYISNSAQYYKYRGIIKLENEW